MNQQLENRSHASTSGNQQDHGFFANNGLSIVLFSLFTLFLAGQAASGWKLFNQTQAAHGLQAVSWSRYITSGTFLEPVFENWQAAILQLAALIFFGIFLRQRGAAHSQKPGAVPKKGSATHFSGRPASWFYRHSLVLALLALFFVFFTCHLLAGAAAYRTEMALNHQPQLSLSEFARSPMFWFNTFQTWQAEFFAIGLYLTFTIFLREQGSPESKPVEASNAETDETDG